VSKTRSRELQKQLTDELRGLARLLQEEGVISDAGRLQQAADTCRVYERNRTYFWEYEVTNLFIGPIDVKKNKYRHFRPRNLVEFTVELNVQLGGRCLPEDDLSNPFTALQVDLELIGENEEGDCVSCAMHLDRQPDVTPGEDDASPLFAHPGYHFHFGGRNVWSKTDAEFGSNLLLESPRLVHPPLDAILAVDFVLSNYMPNEWQYLRSENAPYRYIIESAQKRYWKPYAMASIGHWHTLRNPVDWDADLIWPHLYSSK
jgi:hypothetical protein